jgi:hypothetical protein
VQALLKLNAAGRKTKRSESGALLQGKLFDDKGNRMSPSFSTKNGVRYRFYVSSALLRGRKDAAGSVPRVSAQEIEGMVEPSIRERVNGADKSVSTESIFERIGQVTLKAKSVDVTARLSCNDDNPIIKTFELPWAAKDTTNTTRIEPNQKGKLDQKVLQSVVRAHAWLSELSHGTHDSIENLATAAGLHPKVIRQALRLAFLAPELTQSILQGGQPGCLSLATIPFALPLRWTDQDRALSSIS